MKNVKLLRGAFLVCALLTGQIVFGQVADKNAALKAKMDKMALEIEPKVIAWRRDFHEHPELSNRETRTAEKVAAHLKSLKFDEVKTGVAKTGVIGVLKGGKPGPTVALRADMDGLPVTERGDLPFKSVVKTTYNNQATGVMHACGHDTHVAILMGTAEIMAKMRSELAGTFVFLFQPSEEGAPTGELGGAGEMIKEGALDNPKVETIFGLHVNSQTPINTLTYRSGGTMASSDRFYVTIKGKQTHGAKPWDGIDPIVTGAQIIMGLQTVVSRMTPLNQSAAVITVGMFQAGNRENIIPEEAKLMGTIRCLDPKIQLQIHENIKKVVKGIAESAGATADVKIELGNPVTYNNPELTKKMLPSLEDAAGGENNVRVTVPTTGAEDFAKYQEKIPGFFFFLGGMSKGKAAYEVAPHHTPDFFIDEGGFTLGVKAFCHLVVDYAAKK